MTMEKFLQKEIDKIGDDWTKFIEAEFQKESWDGTQFVCRWWCYRKLGDSKH